MGERNEQRAASVQVAQPRTTERGTTATAATPCLHEAGSYEAQISRDSAQAMRRDEDDEPHIIDVRRPTRSRQDRRKAARSPSRTCKPTGRCTCSGVRKRWASRHRGR